MTPITAETTAARVAAVLRQADRLIVVSHSRPDGDAIGSSLAMAYALRALGKSVRVVSHDPAPAPMQVFPGVPEIEVTDRVDASGATVVVMECSDLSRTGVDGLAQGQVVNIDHHPGNSEYGAVNWLDLSAAACGEMVYELVRELGVPLTTEIATHVYVTIVTDTGGFHYSHISPRTFEICRLCTEAGVDPPAVARSLFDHNSLGRVRIFGAVLNAMKIEAGGAVALLAMDRQLAAACGATYDDTEGLINFPLTVASIQAVAFFKETGDADWRVSMRSKGRIDVNAIAKRYGGGGHTNASGCSATGDLAGLEAAFAAQLAAAIPAAELTPTSRA
jgi:bifunctional oligoribonuclease and PAP phosphatase NrnA